MHNRALAAIAAGDLVRARPLLEQSLGDAERLGDEQHVGNAHGGLGILDLYERRYEDAAPRFVRCLESALRTGWRINVVYSLRGLAVTSAAGGDLEAAARLLGASEVIEEEIGERIQGYAARIFDETADPCVHARIGEPSIGTAYGEGRAMTGQRRCVRRSPSGRRSRLLSMCFFAGWRALGRLGCLRHPLEPRARAGDRAAGQGLLGVRPARHGLRPAGRPGPERARRDLPLDRAHPVEPARGRALGARRDRRRLSLPGDHDARAALQPDEAEPRRRARPRPHHHGRRPRARPGEPRIPAGARRADPDDGPDFFRAAERDHRREGDPLCAARGRRHRHRRPSARERRALSYRELAPLSTRPAPPASA